MPEQQKPRKLQVLEQLSKSNEPVNAADIAGLIGGNPRDVGKDLNNVKREGLAQKPGDKKLLWVITEKGKKYIENPPVPSVRPSV